MKRYRIYTAGPDVFLPDPLEHAQRQHAICNKYGFIALHPFDNEVDNFTPDIRTAMRIYFGNLAFIRECHIVAANCNPFRGMCADDGTSYELGYGNALGKPSYGYLEDASTLLERIAAKSSCQKRDLANKIVIDREGYTVENFGLSLNLMLQCGILHRKGRLVEGTFERCIATIRNDIELGHLVIPD